MVQKQVTEEKKETPAPGEPSRVSLHIYMAAEGYERIKKWAKYATIEGLIKGHPSGNFTQYCNFCFGVGAEYLKHYILKKRGYK